MQEILQAVCPSDAREISTAHGKEYGCDVCPGFSSFRGEHFNPRGRLNFQFSKILTGSFTAARAKQTLAEFFGCEPHSENFGGTLLLEDSGTSLQRVRFYPGIIGMLRTWRMKDGRDVVLTQGGDTGQGVSTNWVPTFKFPAVGGPVQRMLVEATDSFSIYC